MKQLVVYDLDGTLVDTLEDIAQSANHMLAALGLAPVSARQIRQYVGRGVYELVKRCLSAEDVKRIDGGLRIYRAHYGAHLLDHSRLYPGARELLDYFKSRTQAVITNKPNPYSREILHGLGVAGYFVDIIGGDSMYPRKPDPSALLALMAGCGVRAVDTLLIGDSPVDVETGKSAGVLTVAIAHGLADEEELMSAAPDQLVRNFDELLTLAKQRGW